MLNYKLLIKIFCEVDDFCIKYNEFFKTHSLPQEFDKTFKVQKSSMALSEIMTIVIYFHLSGYRCFKRYYKDYVCEVLKSYFPKTLSYTRFIEIMRSSLIPLTLYTTMYKTYKCNGKSFIDSTPIKVCDNRRIHSNKVFKGLAERGKSSMGWFYGFKLHIVINDLGEILSFSITPGNIDDRNTKVVETITKNVFGKLFGDRGYISQKLFDLLFKKSIKLVTKLKSNMKNKLIEMEEKLMLARRGIIESVNNLLKNTCQIEHTRHRSETNFLVNLISGIAAYSYIDKKPSIRNIQNLK